MKPKKQKNKKLSSYPLDYAALPIPDLLAKAVERLYAELVKSSPNVAGGPWSSFISWGC